MPPIVTTLTDVARDIWLDSFAVGSVDVPMKSPAAWSIRKRTLRGGLRDGVDLVEVDNGALSFLILPTRGMGIWRGQYRGVSLGWQSPVVGPVHPQFVALGDRHGLGWLTGFDEWLCRCGLHSMGAPGDDNSYPLNLHGRIANSPAHKVEAVVDSDAQLLGVTGEVEEGGLFYPHLRLSTSVTTALGSNAITIVDAVENRSAKPVEIEMLYHLNNGPPLLEAGSRIRMPVSEVTPMTKWAAEGIGDWNVCAGPVAGFAERVYCCVPAAGADGRTLAVLHDAAGGKGLAIHWDVKQMPCCSLWKNTAAVEDGYVVGLEPATSFPQHRSMERAAGRVLTLSPGGTWQARWTIEVYDDAEAVAKAVARVDQIQSGVKSVVRREPLT
jgi:hypothetical protein